jgi:separase
MATCTSGRRAVRLKPSSSVDPLFSTKLAIGKPESKLSAMLSVNAASQDLSRVIQSGWKKSSSSSKATLQSTTSSASAAVKHVAVLRNLCPDDVDVERAAASILGKLVALELVSLLLYQTL